MNKIDTELFKKYVPEILINPGIQLLAMIESAKESHKRMIKIAEDYNNANKCFEEYKNKVIRRTSSNNWLKMHGYPMRRKKRS